MSYQKVKNRKRHWNQNAGRQHDGFRVTGTEGGYMFTEGKAPPERLLTHQEHLNLDACARKRGIGKGYFVVQAPQENGCKYGTPTTRYHL